MESTCEGTVEEGDAGLMLDMGEFAGVDGKDTRDAGLGAQALAYAEKLV